jgi:hypothetical protein
VTSIHRRVVLFGLLAFSVGAAAWVSDNPHDPDEAAAVPAANRRAASASDAKPDQHVAADRIALPLDKLQRQPMTVGENNPFLAKSWYVAPPAPAVPPPVKSTVPPLPFVFAGKLQEDDGALIIYLVKGEQSFAVKQGETFDNVYKLEGIEDGNLVIQYLPLSVKQLLPIGSDS